MKKTAGCLIAFAILLLWMLTVEVALSIILKVRAGTFDFNWLDIIAACGWYAPCILLLVMGIAMWRRKPKSWLW